MRHFVWAILLSFVFAFPVQAEEPPTIESVRAFLEQKGPVCGLVVRVGSSDGAWESALAAARPGRVLVQGVLAGPNADVPRQRIMKDGMTGYADVAAVPDFKALPFNDNVADLVIADLAAPGAPTRDEVMRIVQPFGRALLKTKAGAAWEEITKPLPAKMDEWTHYDRAADGNPQSRDQLIEAPRGLQWQTANGGGRIGSTVRLAGGRWLRSSTLLAPVQTGHYFTARNAFTGLTQWRLPDGVARGPQERMIAANNDVVVGVFGKPGPAQVLDARTGAVRLVLDQGLLAPVKEKYPTATEFTRPITMQTLLLEERIIQALDQTVVGLGLSDGKRQWDWTCPDKRYLAYIAAGDGRIYVSLSERPTLHYIAYNNQFADISDILALDEKTGKLLWTVAFEKKRAFCSFGIMYHRGGVYTIDAGYLPHGQKPGRYANGPYGDVIGLEAATGKLMFRRNVGETEPRDTFWHHKMRAQDEWLIPTMSSTVRTFSIKDGSEGPVLFKNGGNFSFCSVVRGTARGHIGGSYANFVDYATNVFNCMSITRGGCDEGSYPAYGMIFSGTDGCGCTSYLRGDIALQCSQDTWANRIPDDQRLERGPAYGTKPNAATNASADWPMLLADAARTSSTAQALTLPVGKLTTVEAIRVPLRKPLEGIGTEWAENNALLGNISPVVGSGDTLVVAETDARLIRAYNARDGALRWTHLAGGRVSSSPTIYQGLVLFGSHDGTVTALSLADGTLAWRFTAAPARRQIMVTGQLESVWPVHGTILVVQDKIFVAAGRMNQVDGGVFLYRLHPHTGAMEANTVITYQATNEDPPRPSISTAQGKIADALSTNAAGTLVYMGPICIEPKTLSWANLGLIPRRQGVADAKSPFRKGEFFWTKRPQIGWATPDLLSYIFAPTSGMIDRRVSFATKDMGGFRFMATGSYQSGYSGLRMARMGRTLYAARGANLEAIDFNEQWLPVAEGTPDEIAAIRRNPARRLATLPPSVTALAVSKDHIFVLGNEGNSSNLQIMDIKGTVLSTIKIKSRAVTYGLSIHQGSLWATLEDGSVRRLDAASQ